MSFIFVFITQIFIWAAGSFTLTQTLDFEENIVSVTPFTHEAVPYLLVCVDKVNVSCLLLQWTNGRFHNPQPLKVTGRAMQVETINTTAENTLLLFLIEGNLSFFGIM